MVGVWWSIAKAEFLVRTVKLHRARKILYPALVGLSFLFALFATPSIISFFLRKYGPGFDIMLATSLPGLMRTMMLVVWLVVLIIPISNSLDNVKTDQWDILFSTNVKTSEILFGTYLGKISIYGLLAIILSSIVVAPFVYVYDISVFGQLMMYSIIILFAVATIWLSNVISTALHAKIGQSPRGDDIAKALSWAVIPIVAIPAMGALYWSGQIVALLGLEVSMILPSTWIADILTWIAVNNSSLPPSSIFTFKEYWFQISPILSVGLVSVFIFGIYYFGFKSADTLFEFGDTFGSKKVTTVGSENIAIRGIRKVFGANFGIIMAISLKDYTRKLQNIAKISYAIFLSLLVPLLIGYGPLASVVPDPIFVPVMTAIIIGMMLGIFGGIVFGGIGLLDSQDQLWILKSTPSGIPRYIAARVLTYMMLGVVIALIPSILSGVLLNLSLSAITMSIIYTYSVVMSGIFIGVGITAFNPSYADSSSSAFVINTIATILITMIALMIGIIPGILYAIHNHALVPALLIAATPAPVAGILVLTAGTLKLHFSEVV